MLGDRIWDYRPSNDVPLEEWLVHVADRYGLVPADEPWPTIDDLGLSVLRFQMIPDDGGERTSSAN